MRKTLVIIVTLIALLAVSLAAQENNAKPSVRSSYLEERARFRTKLIRRGPAPGSQSQPTPPAGIETITYASGDLSLRAWLSAPDAARTRPAPALVFFHGGSEQSAFFVEQAQAFRDAGFVVLFPMLRGENGNPGLWESLVGEIDDAAAAVRWIAAQPFVDPSRIYTYGHSTGAAVSLLLALRDDVPVRLGGSSAGLYTADSLKNWTNAPFDVTDERERRMRTPIEFIQTISQRHVTFVGRDEYSAERVAEFRRLSAGSKLEIREVDGDHMGCLGPALAQFLRIVISDLAMNRTEASQLQRETHAAPASTTVTDIDGNVYRTVTIGNQVWMAEDLKTTRYRNGDLIGTTRPATLDISGESTPKYQWAYAGDESNVATYGRLYTWYAATDSRKVCPAGWHVPSDAEWNTLIDCLGGEEAAQGKLKEADTVHWHSPNTDATNESGFTALPSGNRFNKEFFMSLGDFTHWWTATEYDANYAWRRTMWKRAPMDNTGGYADKKIGWLVRCVRDASTLASVSLAAQEDKGTSPCGLALSPLLPHNSASIDRRQPESPTEMLCTLFEQRHSLDKPVSIGGTWGDGEDRR
jgi:uncharacterized protein (TIGR02145 family)